MWIATAAEMGAIEGWAVARGVSLETLMENAGKAVFSAVQRRTAPGGTIAVACGPGNNGGDGLVVARLAHQAGYGVRVLIAAEPGSLKGLPALQLDRLEESGVEVCWLSGDCRDLAYSSPDLTIDAILGTGADRPLTGLVESAVKAVQMQAPRVVSVDVPSGVCPDDGRILGPTVIASETVVLGFAKPYLFHAESARCAGDWSVVDIGLPVSTISSLLPLPNARVAEETPFVSRPPHSNKGDHGRVLIVAGSRRYRGAAVLAALGAVRAGAGLVTVAAIEPVLEAVAAQVPEAVLLPVPEEDGVLSSNGAIHILDSQDRFTSAVFGPGLTTHPSVNRMLGDVWRQWRVPSVIDADALNLVAQGAKLPDGLCLLTPHPGEAARLLGVPVADVQADRFASVRRLAAKFRSPVLLKGACSAFSHHENPLVIVNPSGNPGMASAGMGDVLAGVVAALVKQVARDVTDALWQAALLHGQAGDIAAEEIGGIGYSASDLAHFLPRARSILTT